MAVEEKAVAQNQQPQGRQVSVDSFLFSAEQRINDGVGQIHRVITDLANIVKAQEAKIGELSKEIADMRTAKKAE